VLLISTNGFLVIQNARAVPRLSESRPLNKDISTKDDSSTFSSKMKPMDPGSRGDVRKSERVLNKADSLRERTRRAIDACKNSRNYKPAIALAEELESMPYLTLPVATNAIRLYGEAKQLGRALSILNKLKVQSVEPNVFVFGALINAARIAGQWMMAVELFNRMEDQGIAGNTIVYNTIIKTLGDFEQLALVEEYLQKMDEMRIEKDVVTYSTCVTAYERNNQWQKAMEVFDNMTEKGFKGNTYTLNAVLLACSKGRQWKEALFYLTQARSIGIKPNVAAYSIVISQLGDAKQLNLAQRLFDDMEKDGGEALLKAYAKKTINTIKYAKNRNDGVMSNNDEESNGACSGELPITGLLPPPPFSSTTTTKSKWETMEPPSGDNWEPVRRDTRLFNAMLTAFERNQCHTDALDVFNLMLEKDIKPDSHTFSAAIAACGNAGEWQKALSLFEMMEEFRCKKDTVIYNTMIGALHNADLSKVEESTFSQFSQIDLEQMPNYAKELYVQGLREGMLKHSGGKNIGNKLINNDDATADLLYWWKDIVSRELAPAGQKAIAGDSTDMVKDVLNRLNFWGNEQKSDTSNQVKVMDLHRFPLSVAKAAIDYVLSELINRISRNIDTLSKNLDQIPEDFQWNKNTFDLKIITGRGNHVNSEGKRGVLRSEIELYITKNIEPQHKLTCVRMSDNDGVLIIPKESIEKWVKAKILESSMK
jgi:pentatricopeptide repeat protein